MVAPLVVAIEEAESPVAIEALQAPFGSLASIEEVPATIEFPSPATAILMSPTEIPAPH